MELYTWRCGGFVNCHYLLCGSTSNGNLYAVIRGLTSFEILNGTHHPHLFYVLHSVTPQTVTTRRDLWLLELSCACRRVTLTFRNSDVEWFRCSTPKRFEIWISRINRYKFPYTAQRPWVRLVYRKIFFALFLPSPALLPTLLVTATIDILTSSFLRNGSRSGSHRILVLPLSLHHLTVSDDAETASPCVPGAISLSITIVWMARAPEATIPDTWDLTVCSDSNDT